MTGKVLALAREIEVAQGMEAAENDAKNLKGHNADSPMQRIHAQRGAASNGPNKKQGGTVLDKLCHRCGKKNHLPADCRYKDAVCNYRHKKGHLAEVCRKLPQAVEKKKTVNKKTADKQQHGDVKWV